MSWDENNSVIFLTHLMTPLTWPEPTESWLVYVAVGSDILCEFSWAFLKKYSCVYVLLPQVLLRELHNVGDHKIRKTLMCILLKLQIRGCGHPLICHFSLSLSLSLDTGTCYLLKLSLTMMFNRGLFRKCCVPIFKAYTSLPRTEMGENDALLSI